MIQHDVLVSIEQETVKGIESLKEIFLKIRLNFDVVKISSIYKRYLNQRQEDLNSTIFLVIHLQTEKTKFEVRDILNSISRKITFLSFDQIVHMSPELTLPDPCLVKDSGILRCATEAYGSFHHPIVNETLNETLSSKKNFDLIEFYGQGSLLQ